MSDVRGIPRSARRSGGPTANADGARLALADDPPGAPRVEIPVHRRGDWRSRAILAQERGAVAEQFRHLAVRVRSQLATDGQRTLAVTSATRGDGKTTVVCNFALAMASVCGDDRVALVEFDLRRPRVGEGLGVRPEVGIESVLAGEASLESARIRTQFDSLDLFLVRDPQMRAHELLSGPHTSGLVRSIASRYRFVIVDTPPVLLVPDTPLLIPEVDAALIIVRRGHTRLAALTSALDLLPEEKLLGVFVNELASPVRSREYGYYAAK